MCSNTLKVCNNNPLSLVLKTFSPNLSFDFSNDIVEHIRNLIFVVNHLFISLRSLKWSKVKWSRSVVSDSATPWTVAYQAPLSMGFSRQEYWSGLPFWTHLTETQTLLWAPPNSLLSMRHNSMAFTVTLAFFFIVKNHKFRIKCQALWFWQRAFPWGLRRKRCLDGGEGHKIWNASGIRVSSLLRGHTNLCIVPILVYVLPKRDHPCFVWLLVGT